MILICHTDLVELADLGGAPGTSDGPIFFSISCSFWEIWQNRMLAPPGGLAPLNPGSAPGRITQVFIFLPKASMAWSCEHILIVGKGR